MRSFMQPRQRRFDFKDTEDMNDKTEIRHEGMRIGGEVVFTDDVVPVKYPYTDEVIGTVPACGDVETRRAIDAASA